MEIESFIERWTRGLGGAERANYAMFLSELCDVIGVARPDPASGGGKLEDYVFEGPVRSRETEGVKSNKRIDLYKKGCFILEAKQSHREKADAASARQAVLPGMETAEPLGRRSGNKSWDVMMLNARAQAEGYVARLPTHHPAPPFLIVCDVGHSLEIFADFSGTGRNYGQFPDRKSYRIFLEDLRKPDVIERLKAVWLAPESLDPTRERARVTRDIAKRLAEVSKSLEKNHPADDVAQFLMRCVFTMFAEDVKLLPEDGFTRMLEDCIEDPKIFVPILESLWAHMDSGGFDAGVRAHVRRFNGGLFKNARALPLEKADIGELRAAAKADWKQVEPAIFGTLLEQALEVKERAKLGAHFTPRAYVDRLVNVVVIEPLRREWEGVKLSVYDLMEDHKDKDALAVAQKFHHRLCAIRVLDPACGTGNFLYAALELMKRLESEVLDFYADLGGSEGLGFETIDPHQFLGIELNPRAAAIAELVVWIGYLQWHYRTKTGHPEDPILKDFHNITSMDAVLTWDGYPAQTVPDGQTTFAGARLPDWPEAEFIVGNPPFIGKGELMRSALGDSYVRTLWSAHPKMNESADFVMYWWDIAARLLLRKKSVLRRFGFVTTNSISQVFNRRTMERYLATKSLRLVMAVPDHPWTKATKDAAAVRIAMTVAEAVPTTEKLSPKPGNLLESLHEAYLDTDEPIVELRDTIGQINSDLSVGADVTSTRPLLSNNGISSNGMMLAGSGFIVTPSQAEFLGLGRRAGLENHIRPYRNGRDMTAHARGVMVIDMFGLSETDIRTQYPEVYQHILGNVKPERDKNRRDSFRINWWRFGEPRKLFRDFMVGLERYIATVETTKHRVFQFIDSSVVPDHMLVNIGSKDAFLLGTLSSKYHAAWALRAGGWLGMGNDPRYSKSRCFDPFPFPDATPAQKTAIGEIAEELDAHRKQVLAEHSQLTLTGLYNVVERLRTGIAPDDLTPDERVIFDKGLVLILKEYHDRLDAAVCAAYGWPADISDDDILANLVALNKQRSLEEAAGEVRWLRPDYQIPRFARAIDRKSELDLGVVEAAILRPSFPKDRTEQPLAVKRLLETTGAMSEDAVVRAFDNGGRNRTRILSVLQTLDRYGEIILENGQAVVNRAA